MKRFTTRDALGAAILNDAAFEEDTLPVIKTVKALARLAEYEEAEEQGRLVVLPLKVGDTVWFILPDGNKCEYFVSNPHTITEVGSRGFWTSSLPRDCSDAMDDFTSWNEMGQTAFCTREEAEATLRKETENED